jgi:hypothetical protein
MSILAIRRLLQSTLSSPQSPLLTLAFLSIGWLSPPAAMAMSKSTANAPSAITTAIAKIDAAANNRQITELLRHYSPNFKHSDGLDKVAWQKSLTQFWQSYNNLRYTTKIKSWRAEGSGYSTETITNIVGTQNVDGRKMNLQSTIESRQKIVRGQIVSQEILQERTQITSGSQPPTIELNLPTKLQTNTEYNFDAIVKEPLGEDVLMGATTEEIVSPQGYTKPNNYKLELLTAGGLFKIARAPGKSGDYWLSTVFIRSSGMTIMTQRVHVMGRK